MGKTNLNERYSLLFRGAIKYTPKEDKFENPAPMRLTHYEDLPSGAGDDPASNFLARTTDTYLPAGYATLLNIAMDYVPDFIEAEGAIDETPYIPPNDYLPPDFVWQHPKPVDPTDPGTDPDNKRYVRYQTPIVLGPWGVGEVNLVRYYIGANAEVKYQFVSYDHNQIFLLCLQNPQLRAKFEHLVKYYGLRSTSAVTVDPSRTIFDWTTNDPKVLVNGDPALSYSLNSQSLLLAVMNDAYVHQMYFRIDDLDSYESTKQAYADTMDFIADIVEINPINVNAIDVELPDSDTPKLLKLFPASTLPYVVVTETKYVKRWFTGSTSYWFLYATKDRLELRMRGYGYKTLRQALADNVDFRNKCINFIFESIRLYSRIQPDTVNYPDGWYFNAAIDSGPYIKVVQGNDRSSLELIPTMGSMMFICLGRDASILGANNVARGYELALAFSEELAKVIIPLNDYENTYTNQTNNTYEMIDEIIPQPVNVTPVQHLRSADTNGLVIDLATMSSSSAFSAFSLHITASQLMTEMQRNQTLRTAFETFLQDPRFDGMYQVNWTTQMIGEVDYWNPTQVYWAEMQDYVYTLFDWGAEYHTNGKDPDTDSSGVDTFISTLIGQMSSIPNAFRTTTEYRPAPTVEELVGRVGLSLTEERENGAFNKYAYYGKYFLGPDGFREEIVRLPLVDLNNTLAASIDRVAFKTAIDDIASRIATIASPYGSYVNVTHTINWDTKKLVVSGGDWNNQTVDIDMYITNTLIEIGGEYFHEEMAKEYAKLVLSIVDIYN